MTREYLILNDQKSLDGKKRFSMIKTYSFTTDDDELENTVTSKQIQSISTDNQIKQRKSRQIKPIEVNKSKTNLFFD